jgi:MSHA biogenesis protein MshQ
LDAIESNQRNPATFVQVGVAEAGSWFNQGAWTARKPLSIDPAATSTDLVDVAVPIQFADDEIAASARADGLDLVFTVADGVTRLDHVLEDYDPTTGAVTAWVSVPTLSASEPTGLFVYYANASANDQQDPEAVFGEAADLALVGTE